MLRTSLVISLLLATPSLAAPFKGDVSFTAVVEPLGISTNVWTFDGTGGKAEGDDAGTITVNLADFKTDKDGRDEHMNEVLETARFPTAKLDVGSHDAKVFVGTLTLHGVSKPITGKVDGKTATFKIKASDFGIKGLRLPKDKTLPTLLNVQDEITVRVTAK